MLRTRSFPIAAVSATVMLVAAVPSAWAQKGSEGGNTGAPPAAGGAAAETVAQQVRDLSLLHALLPLKLTKGQIDALLPILKDIAKADVGRRKQDEEALVALGADISKARTAALNGEAPPKELEDRVVALGKDAAKRLVDARKDAVLKLWPTVNAFTADQKEEIEVQSRAFFGGRRVPAQYSKNPSQAPKEEVQALALKAFIEGVLLDDRAPVVLEKLKPAEGSGGSTAPATKPAESGSTAPAAPTPAQPQQ